MQNIEITEIDSSSDELSAMIHLDVHLFIWYTGSRGDGMYSFYDNYVAIIGDIIDSKKIEDRKGVQQRFRAVLSNINVKYSEDIVALFSITLGDEFQGLLRNRGNIINIITEIEMGMAPIQLRFGVGIGDIDTDIQMRHSAEVDGPAYHRARKMVEEIESKRSQYTARSSHIMICSHENNVEIDELLNSILSVCTALKLKWTSRQVEIIYTYLLNDENQYKTAKALNIGQPSVNKALNNANFYTYRSAMNTVSTFLSKNRRKSID